MDDYGWSMDVIIYVKNIGNKSAMYTWMHEKENIVFDRYGTYMTIGSIAASLFTGTIALIQTAVTNSNECGIKCITNCMNNCINTTTLICSQTCENICDGSECINPGTIAMSIVLAFISYIIALIIAINASLDYPGLAKAHDNSGDAYSELYLDIQKTISTPLQKRPDGNLFAEKITVDFKRIKSESPKIKDTTRAEFRRVFIKTKLSKVRELDVIRSGDSHECALHEQYPEDDESLDAKKIDSSVNMQDSVESIDNVQPETINDIEQGSQFNKMNQNKHIYKKSPRNGKSLWRELVKSFSTTSSDLPLTNVKYNPPLYDSSHMEYQMKRNNTLDEYMETTM